MSNVDPPIFCIQSIGCNFWDIRMKHTVHCFVLAKGRTYSRISKNFCYKKNCQNCHQKSLTNTRKKLKTD